MTEPNLRFPAAFCEKSSVFCENLRLSTKICGLQCLNFQETQGVNLRKSAVLCENLRFGFSLSPLGPSPSARAPWGLHLFLRFLHLLLVVHDVLRLHLHMYASHPVWQGPHYRASLKSRGGALTRRNDICVTPGMTVRWRSAPCASPLYCQFAIVARILVVPEQRRWCHTRVTVRVSHRH